MKSQGKTFIVVIELEVYTTGNEDTVRRFVQDQGKIKSVTEKLTTGQDSATVSFRDGEKSC
jgi:hypothetical protein